MERLSDNNQILLAFSSVEGGMQWAAGTPQHQYHRISCSNALSMYRQIESISGDIEDKRE